MDRMGGGILVVLLTLLGAAAQDKGGDESVTTAEQYKALLKEYQAASSGRVASDEERMKFVGRVYKRRYEIALQFLELAERNPKDPIALDALIQAVWQVNNIPWPAELVGTDSAAARALAIFERDHVRSVGSVGSERLGPVCQRISVGFAKEYETFLRTVLGASPHKPVQAAACLGLAHFLTNRLQRLDLIKQQQELSRLGQASRDSGGSSLARGVSESGRSVVRVSSGLRRLTIEFRELDPPYRESCELAKEFADLFGKEYLEELERQDRTTASAEAEALFEQAVEK